MQRRVPPQAPRAGAAHNLIERERVRVRSHLLARLGDRHVPHARSNRRVLRQRGDDGVDGLVPLVVRVEYAGGGRIVDQARVELTQITVVDEGPVVLARAHHADEPVRGVPQQVSDDAASAAVDDAGPHDDRAHARRRGVQNSLLVRGTPGHELGRIDRRALVCRVARVTQRPHTRRVDDEPIGSRGQRRQRRDDHVVELSRARAGLRGGVHDAIGSRGGLEPRERLEEIAAYRLRPPRLQFRGGRRRPDERVDVVMVPDECLEDGATDVPRCPCEEDPHGENLTSID